MHCTKKDVVITNGPWPYIWLQYKDSTFDSCDIAVLGYMQMKWFKVGAIHNGAVRDSDL